MLPEPDYQSDTEFRKLLARRSDIDLAVAALELARDADPQIVFRETLDWIDAVARQLGPPAARSKSEREALDLLGRCIADENGIFGDTACFDRAESSYLNRVIETKRGLPISLSLLYMAVGSRIGLELQGVSAPKHFLVRYESVDGPLFLDAFSKGRILTWDECCQWMSQLAARPVEEVAPILESATPRTIVIRMLNNLKAVYAGQENWQAAWIVQHRLTALQPAAYQERRDLAMISAQANRPWQAVDLFQACLKICPKQERHILEHHLDKARTQLSQWN